MTFAWAALGVMAGVICFLLWFIYALAKDHRTERRTLLNSALARTASEQRIMDGPPPNGKAPARDPLAVPALEGYEGPVGL